MFKQWLIWINLGIALCIGLLVLGAISLSLFRSEVSASVDLPQTKRPIPSSPFALSQPAYDAIGRSVCELKFSPLTMQLPDLRHHLIYYGKNGRPDACADSQVMHFAFVGNPTITPVVPGERLYLSYDKKRSPPHYVCSANNAPTPLWIEGTIQGNEAFVKVSLQNDLGEVIREPAHLAQLTLNEKETPRHNGKFWEIGKWRVDGGLLGRQKARWLGPDLFMERHGGPEYQDIQGKHRIEFSDEDENYSVFVGVNDSLIWSEDRWRAAQPGENTLSCPLMVAKKIEDRVITFELWDTGGKNKILLSLVRMNEPWSPRNLQDGFKFLGARTRSQYIFEVDDERVLISPEDWLVQTDEGWRKLTKAQEIDDYVDRKLTGVLFVFDGVAKVDDRQVLKGVIFNPSRTEMQEVELVVQKGIATSPADSSEESFPSSDDDDEESESDDDEAETAKAFERAVMK